MSLGLSYIKTFDNLANILQGGEMQIAHLSLSRLVA